MGYSRINHYAKMFSVWFLSGLTSRLPFAIQWRVGNLIDRLMRYKFLKPNGNLRVQRQGGVWDLNPADYVCRDLLWYGKIDPREMSVIKQHLKEGAMIFDVGANFGFYSITACKHLHNKCTIYSIEPNPPVYERLCANITRNNVSGVIPCKVAFGDRKGVQKLFTMAWNSGGTYLQSIDASGGSEIQVTTLDDFVAEQKINGVDFIKVDVEGYEEMFLKGGVNTLLAYHPLILIEICPDNLRRAGSTPEGVVSLLHSCGYNRLTCMSSRGAIPFDPACFKDKSSLRNVFCAKS